MQPLQLLAGLALIWRLFGPGDGFAPLEWYPNEPYKVVENAELTVDIYAPARWLAPGPTPAVLLIHGGVWRLDLRHECAGWAQDLAQEAGMAGVVVQFRLEPKRGFMDQVADIKDAVRWLRLHADEYNIDRNRIGIYGSSSGAHLAALAAFAGDEEGWGDDWPGASSRIQAACLVYGIYDLTAIEESAVPHLFYHVAAAYCMNAFGTNTPDFARASPINYIDGSEPPVMLIHGTMDPWAPVAQIEEMAARLKTARVPIQCLVFDDFGHGFVHVRPLTRPLAQEAMTSYFRAVFGEDSVTGLGLAPF